MCLTADYRFHSHRKAFVTEEDLVVYKKLLTCGGTYFTPMQLAPVYFENGTATLESKFSFSIYHGRYFHVNKGIHCYCSTNFGKHRLRGYKHYAIIPKGTKYYADIFYPCLVAHKLIIFKSINDFRKYCEEHNINSDKYTHGKD